MTSAVVKQMNVFAGGRRLALVGAVAIVAYSVWEIAFPEPVAAKTVLLDEQGVGTPSPGDCPAFWSDSSVLVVGPSGNRLRLLLCATSRATVDAGASRPSDVLTWTDLEQVEEQAKPLILLQRKIYAGIGVAALVAYAVMVWLIGWIVRGFLGIPRGMDRRPENVPSAPGEADGLR